jgi:hypothetical protein
MNQLLVATIAALAIYVAWPALWAVLLVTAVLLHPPLTPLLLLYVVLRGRSRQVEQAEARQPT